jgi:hypothetical protein
VEAAWVSATGEDRNTQGLANADLVVVEFVGYAYRRGADIVSLGYFRERVAARDLMPYLPYRFSAGIHSYARVGWRVLVKVSADASQDRAGQFSLMCTAS